MKKTVVIVFMLIVSILFSVPAYAQSAKEAVFGLKKLQARCQAGIAYRDYSNALADAKFPVNLYMESSDAKKNPELTDSINKVMGHYEYAGTLWNSKMLGLTIDEKYGFFTVDSKRGREISSLYPQASQALTDKKDSYFLDGLLPIIWGAASQELENATKLYAKIEGDTSNDIDKLKKENEQLKAENANLKKRLEVLKSKKTK
jgi:hypothetical protein